MAEMIMTARRLVAELSWQRLTVFIVLAVATIGLISGFVLMRLFDTILR